MFIFFVLCHDFNLFRFKVGSLCSDFETDTAIHTRDNSGIIVQDISGRELDFYCFTSIPKVSCEDVEWDFHSSTAGNS